MRKTPPLSTSGVALRVHQTNAKSTTTIRLLPPCSRPIRFARVPARIAQPIDEPKDGREQASDNSCGDIPIPYRGERRIAAPEIDRIVCPPGECGVDTRKRKREGDEARCPVTERLLISLSTTHQSGRRRPSGRDALTPRVVVLALCLTRSMSSSQRSLARSRVGEEFRIERIAQFTSEHLLVFGRHTCLRQMDKALRYAALRRPDRSGSSRRATLLPHRRCWSPCEVRYRCYALTHTATCPPLAVRRTRRRLCGIPAF